MDLEKEISDLNESIKSQNIIKSHCKIQLNTAFGDTSGMTPRMIENLSNMMKFRTDIMKDINQMCKRKKELTTIKNRQDRINQILK